MVPLMQDTVKRGQLDHFNISFAKNVQMPIMSFQFVHIRINISGNTILPANHFASSYGNSNYRGVARGRNGGQKVGHANSRFFLLPPRGVSSCVASTSRGPLWQQQQPLTESWDWGEARSMQEKAYHNKLTRRVYSVLLPTDPPIFHFFARSLLLF